MLCGSFWIYKNLHIPLWDGGDCHAMETAIEIFTVLLIIAGGVFFTGGLMGRGFLVGSLVLVVFVFLSPFFFYIYAAVTVFFVVCVILMSIFGLVLECMSRCTGKIQKNKSGAAPSDPCAVRIDQAKCGDTGAEAIQPSRLP